MNKLLVSCIKSGFARVCMLDDCERMALEVFNYIEALCNLRRLLDCG